jgi:hypothetical protein
MSVLGIFRKKDSARESAFADSDIESGSDSAVKELLEQNRNPASESDSKPYVIDWDMSVVTVTCSEKVMLKQYEPADVRTQIQVPVYAGSKEELESALEEIMSVARKAVAREAANLRKIAQIMNGGS